jgi:DnaD/phage-associated family protein
MGGGRGGGDIVPKNKGWFRVYDRTLDSPDILQLDDTAFRILFKLWCLASQGGREDGAISYVGDSLQLRIAPTMPKKKFQEIIHRLLAPCEGETSGLLREVNGKFSPRDWERHQFLFDSKKPSFRKQNEKRMGTHREHIGNTSGSVGEHIGQQEPDTYPDTYPETETEADIEKKTAAARTAYQNNICLLTPISDEFVCLWCAEYPLNWILEAIKEAVSAGVRNHKYIDKILLSWKTKGYKAPKQGHPAVHQSKADAKRAEEEAWLAKRKAAKGAST